VFSEARIVDACKVAADFFSQDPVVNEPALTLEFWRQIGVAAVCGAAIGMERQLRGKAMGVRTGLLICVATSMFASMGAAVVGTQGDPSRMIGQIAVGIGFLDGGAIINQGMTVHGLTSAAIIWLLAAVGSMVGLGLHWTPLLVTMAVLVAIAALDQLERRIPWLRRGDHAPPDLRE
jgi:putative Mg2+ transporter-C (MgtC) family protein